MQKQILVHAPTLNTVLMVEKTLKNMEESVVTVAELKRKLPRKKLLKKTKKKILKNSSSN